MGLLFDNVRLWDGIGSSTQRHMSVAAEDGKITWIGSTSDFPGRRAHMQVVDGSARTLIPGLIDCHVHYSSPGGPEWIARFTDPVPEIMSRALELAEASLRSGVTSARDVGAPHGINIRLAHVSAAGHLPIPHVRAAGNWIAHHGTYVKFAESFNSPEELRAAIRSQTDAGADLIKVALAPWRENERPADAPDCPFTAELLAIAVEEVHAASMRIACHANDRAACQIAARAGVDLLEHGMFLDDDDLTAMASRHTTLVPTLSVWDAMLFYGREMEWPAARIQRAETLRDSSRAVVAGAVKAGVPIALGTDSGGGATRHARVAREIELMVECGMDPARALQAGTAVGAQLLGEADVRGTIQPSKVADLLLLDGNPLEDLGALRRIAGVYQAGRRVA